MGAKRWPNFQYSVVTLLINPILSKNPDRFLYLPWSINNPCPAGFRKPTEVEWNNERINWASDSKPATYASPLKLPVPGYRFPDNSDELYDVGSKGWYSSSTITGIDSGVRYLKFYTNWDDMQETSRATALSVRCIKDWQFDSIDYLIYFKNYSSKLVSP